MDFSILEGVLEEGAVYQPVKTLQGADGLLAKFDTKLEACLEKIREKCTPEQKECITLYKTQAVQLRDAITQTNWFQIEGRREEYFQEELLERAIKNFDALLEGKQDDENNEQLLILARNLGKGAQVNKIAAAIFGFLAVGGLLAVCVLAIPTAGLSLLFLINVVHVGASGAFFADISLKKSDKQEKLTSFTETGKGFFSDAEDDEIEPEEKVKKAPGMPFGSEGENS